MPSIINSDSGAVSGSAGLKFTSADDGVLQIQNNGNTAISISSAGIATFAQPPLTAVPAFLAYLNTDQTGFTSAVWQVAAVNDTEFDTHFWYNTNTYRYTPLIAGYYNFTFQAFMRAASDMTQAIAAIGKNGTAGTGVLGSYAAAGFVGGGASVATGVLYMNGIDDYVSPLASATGTGVFLQGTTTPLGDPSVGTVYSSQFSGFLVRAA